MLSPLPDTLHFRTPNRPSATNPTYIIYFITGNPGLISYYTTFLSHLFNLLTSPSSTLSSLGDLDIQVYGRSLSGFEICPVEKAGKGPFTVAQQIAHTEADVQRIVRETRQDGARDVRIILMGHSLGTYIVLELVRRLRGEENEEQGVRVAGGVCLFATVMELAESDSGLKVSLPYFPLVVSVISKLLFSFVPLWFLTYLIRLIMAFPADGARVTASFIQSQDGVRQALFMANDEMTAISTDKWGDEVWGASSAVSRKGGSNSRLKFLFAGKDHWLSDRTRDELIRRRGRKKETGIVGEKTESWKPEMEVDETEGWVHSFCIKQSVPVAERAKGWVEEIIVGDMGERS